LLIGKIRGSDISLPLLLILSILLATSWTEYFVVFNAQGASGCGVCPSQCLLPIFDAHGVPCKANEGLSVVSYPYNFDYIVSFIMINSVS
jgi:hypothetical protein